MTQHLVLLGAGPAHWHLLARQGKHPLPGVAVTLVTSRTRQIPHHAVPAFVAGRAPLDDLALPIEPLVQHSGARWLTRHAVLLDAAARQVVLDDGSTLPYDWLSINTEPAQDRDRIEAALPGARHNALFTCPAEAFCNLWPRAVALAAQKPLRLAVIACLGPASNNLASTADWLRAVEIAFAVRQRLPGSAVTLVAGDLARSNTLPPVAQERLAHLLGQRNITVLHETATGIEPGQVLLGPQTRLACDVPLVTLRSPIAPWLARSGVALDAQGAAALDAQGRLQGQRNILMLGDGAAHGADPSSRAEAAALLRALTAALALQPLPDVPSHDHAVRWVDLAHGHALALWRNRVASGRLVGAVKHWCERRWG